VAFDTQEAPLVEGLGFTKPFRIMMKLQLASSSKELAL
jgi:hypothetical protein